MGHLGTRDRRRLRPARRGRLLHAAPRRGEGEGGLAQPDLARDGREGVDDDRSGAHSGRSEHPRRSGVHRRRHVRRRSGGKRRDSRRRVKRRLRLRQVLPRRDGGSSRIRDQYAQTTGGTIRVRPGGGQLVRNLRKEHCDLVVEHHGHGDRQAGGSVPVFRRRFVREAVQRAGRQNRGGGSRGEVGRRDRYAARRGAGGARH
mmetsp:Transcript_14494/g.27636  ORF Transcript_14494/g.27636 Transcript_14494/m.27636 type:complete len:202 (-) Transcript_14494:376-981(-)